MSLYYEPNNKTLCFEIGTKVQNLSLSFYFELYTLANSKTARSEQEIILYIRETKDFPTKHTEMNNYYKQYLLRLFDLKEA